jgi:hypothetical protein
VIGGALFVAREALFATDPVIEVTISEADRRDLVLGWQRQTGRPPTAEEREGLIRGEVDDRLMLAEAFARGWHRTDPVALRRLIQNQRFLAPDDPATDEELLERAFSQGMDRSDVVVRRRLLERMRLHVQATRVGPEPTRDELAAWLRAHPDRFVEPPRVALSHVYLSRDRRGASIVEDALALGDRLREEAIRPERAVELSDPSLIRSTLPAGSEDAIARQLGAGFAAAAMRAPVGAWSGPVESAYGLHWIWVHERLAARTPSLDEVEKQVRAEVIRAREEEALRDYVESLRARARVVVAPAAQPDDAGR